MELAAGQVALITGGAGGIGLGIARAFGQAGLKVAIADLDATALEAAAEGLRSQGISVLSVVLDVTDPAGWKQAADQVWAQFGRLDVLCNNAGVGQGQRPKGSGSGLVDMPEAAWRLILETNVTAAFLGVREIVPRLLAQGGPAHIVNTASMAGLIAPAGLGAYAASKFALVGMSESLRAELEPQGIGVSVLCPGGVESRLSQSSEARHAAAAGREAQPTRAPGVTLMPADLVGTLVLDGVRANRLHIVTHPEYAPLVEERQQALVKAFDRARASGFLDPEPLLRSSRNPAYAAQIQDPARD